MNKLEKFCAVGAIVSVPLVVLGGFFSFGSGAVIIIGCLAGMVFSVGLMFSSPRKKEKKSKEVT